jgi:type IV pilus assembly protein PilO
MALTWDDIKKMSPLRKVLIIGLIYILLGYFYFFFLLQTGFEKKEALKNQVSTLQQQILEKERLAAQLPKYLKDIAELKESFQLALIKLPEEKEIPDLLRSIAEEGKKVGLDFILFEPVIVTPAPKPTAQKQSEQKQQIGLNVDSQKTAEPEKFYEEVLAKTTINASFNKTVLFFEKLAKLPRIINIEDLSMEEAKDVKEKGRTLSTTFTLKTYMFVRKADEKGK